MRTTIRLDDDLLARARAFAARTGRTLTALIEDALRAALAQGRSSRRRARIELPTFGSGGTLPGVDLDDSAALLDSTESGPGPR
jgi:plasmid stability protein